MKPDEGKNKREAKQVAVSTFEILYNTYRNAVFSFACYLTQNRGEAEDLFQEAWLRIVKKMPKEVNMFSVKAWIFTIVANLHKDALRKKRIRQLFLFQKSINANKEDTMFPNMRGMTGSDPGDEADHAEIRKDISKAIAALPDRQRRVFVLKEIAGFQQVEISDILGMSLGTVKSQMHRAVKRLQRELLAYMPKSIRERGQNEMQRH